MSVLNLDKLLAPASVALIGASDREGSMGRVILENLVRAGFQGEIYPVNLNHDHVGGRQCWKSVTELPATPDLAVVCTPPDSVPGLVREIGVAGTRAAVIISAGLRDGADVMTPMLHTAREFGLRLLGPNCLGILLPHLGLNASFAHTGARPGKLAVLSQSGALCTTILDWAKSRRIGFSCFVSLGDSLDVDFGDLLDYIGCDPKTRGILLYIESIRNARKFMSAARAVARNKTVIAVKAGRFSEGARAATSHTGALAGRDDVFDAALRRAGILRAWSIEDLFDAAETLAHASPFEGREVIIVTNGGGPGVLATDRLASEGGSLAVLPPETVRRLDEVLPQTWSRGNPVDIIGDATPARYLDTLRILAQDCPSTPLLVMLVPTAMADNTAVARALIGEVRDSHRPVFTCWLGGEGVAQARREFAEAGIPTYETPESAIHALMQVADFRDNQRSLMQTPPSTSTAFVAREDLVKEIITRALNEERDSTTFSESLQILAAYDIPTVTTRVARTPAEAAAIADQLGYPVVLKLDSPDLPHKSDAGGVLLNLTSGPMVEMAAMGMEARIRGLHPGCRIDGFVIQPMARHSSAQELIIGATEDPIFGPVILFGQGGTATEIVADRAVGLPPLNRTLAAQLMARTRVNRLLQGYRDVPAVDIDAVQLALIKVSQLITDHAAIRELDINPLIATAGSVLAIDARISLAASGATGPQRLSISPYPRELEEFVELHGHRIMIRPIRPEDEPAHHEFIRRIDPQDLYFRFMRAMHDMSHDQLARLTQIDYDREMALIATEQLEEGGYQTLGVVRVVADADNQVAELAIIVRSDWKGKGLGSALMDRVIRYCRKRGTARITGITLMENDAMQNLARQFSFSVEPDHAQHLINLELDLRDRRPATS